MRQTRWQPFHPMWDQVQQLQTEMNRLLDRWSDPSNGGRTFGGSFPAVNVWENADHVYVEAELPGMDPNDLEIHVTGGNQLTIKGERKQQVPDKAVLHRQERGFGNFVRVLTLPFNVDANKVDARFENGVLVIDLAKHEAAKPRKITVKGE
jgi:HSP20 family protein